MPAVGTGAFRDGGNAKAPQMRARPFRVDTDPRVKNEMAPCVVCGGERTPIGVAHADPFCRRECCELHYTKGD